MVVLVGIGVLAFMLWEPQIEGVNAHATFFEIYFQDAFLAYAYASSITFFTALYQAFKTLGYVRQGKTFSPATVKALRTIRYCALALIVLVAAPLAYLFIVRPGDDIAGGVFIGLLIIFVSVVTASAAAMFEQIVQQVRDKKSRAT